MNRARANVRLYFVDFWNSWISKRNLDAIKTRMVQEFMEDSNRIRNLGRKSCLSLLFCAWDIYDCHWYIPNYSIPIPTIKKVSRGGIPTK